MTKTNANKAYSGVRLGTVSQQLYFSLTNEAANAGGAYSIVPPSAFDSTQWHHYALTRSNGTIYYFVDGNLICTVPLASSVALYTSDSITIGNLLKEDTNTPTIVPYPYSSYHQDLYIAVGYCKWTSNFDPSNITY